MQSHAGIDRKGVEPFAHQLRVKLTHLVAWKLDLEHKHRAARDIDHDTRQRLVHGHVDAGVAGNPGHRAERLLVSGALVEATEARAIGLVDELTGIDEVATRARVWLEGLLQLPRGPVLETRRIARRDVIAALQPERIDLPRFVAAWMQPDTQAGLRAMLARIGK